MGLNKIPSFQEVKDWAKSTLVTSVNGNTGDVSVEGTPSGVISMWSGAISDIPSGWTLCDGTDGTPNLQDRFIVGAGSQYGVSDTGGEDEHTLTVDEMPSHSHTYAGKTSGGGAGDAPEYLRDDLQAQTEKTSTTGGDQPHENRPPYHALAYIMKV